MAPKGKTGKPRRSTNMKTYELTPNNGRKSFYGKAIVKEDNGEKRLYSYDTLVCTIKDGEVHLTSDWDYSATTLTHLRSFLQKEGFQADSKAQIAKLYA